MDGRSLPMRKLALLLLAPVLGCASWPGRLETSPEPFPSAPAPAPVSEVKPLEAPVREVRLSGRLMGKDSAPLVGASVSVMARGDAWAVRAGSPVATVSTQADGSFETGPLAPGEYTVSAFTAAGEVMLGGGFEVDAGEPLPYLMLTLEPTPRVLEGRVVDDAGKPVAGAEVRLCSLGLPPGLVPIGHTTEEGRFRVRAPAGDYALLALAPGFVPAMRAVEPTPGSLSVDVRLGRPADAAQRQEALAGMKAAALPLSSVEPEQGLEDLAPLEKPLHDARVVALGESTPGAHELILLKHRLVRMLVERLGYTTLALDAGFSETRALNDYVLNGEGDPARALQSLYAWPWNTEEMAGLIEWIRHYNEDPAHEQHKVSLYGFGLPSSRGAVVAVLDYLERVDAEWTRSLGTRLEPLESPDAPDEEQRPALRTALDEVAARLDAQRAKYEEALDAEAWALARQQVVLLRRGVELTDDGGRGRERLMADNVQWILQHQGPTAKLVLWSDNTHVARGEDPEVGLRLGGLLAKTLGPALYVFDVSFDQGSFQAFNGARDAQEARQGVVSFSLPAAPAESLEGTLAAVGPSVFALDVRGLSRGGAAAEWWRRPQWARDIGPVFSGGAGSLRPVRVLEDTDGLLFVRGTTRAHPIPEAPPLPERPAEEPAGTTSPAAAGDRG